MNRLGTLLVFKEGTTNEEAIEALEKIKDVLSDDYFVDSDPDSLIHGFDPEWGGPVWYIP